MAGNTNTSDRLPDTQGLQHKPVYEESDFGEFIDDEVLLEDGKWYDIKADFELSSGGLRCPAGAKVVICAACPGTYTITYTNTAKPMFLASGGRDMQLFNFDVVFDSATQDVFDLTGNGVGSMLMQSCKISVIENSGSGLIDGYAGCDFGLVRLANSSAELLIRDCDTVISQCSFSNDVDTSGALVAFESTAPFNFEVFNSKLTPKANESALRISSGTQDAGSRFLASDLVTGAPTGELFDTTALDELDPRVTARDNPGRASSGVSGQGNLEDNVAITTIPSVNAWVMFNANTWAFANESRVACDSAGPVTYVGLEPVLIKLDGNVVMEPATANKKLAASYVKIGVESTSVTFDNTTNTITAAGLSNDDTISFHNTPGTLPVEIRKDLLYFIVSDDQLSYTEGGSAIAFGDDGTGPNSLDSIELVGSRSPISITAGNALEVVVQALTVIDTGEMVSLFVRNESDAVNIEVTHAYSRV